MEIDLRRQKVDWFAWTYDMTNTTAESVCMYFVLTIRMTLPRPWIHLFACIFMFSKSTSIKDEDLEGTDKYSHNTYDGRTRKDTVGRYIVWFRRWRRTAVRMTPNDGACWVRAHTFVIDDGVTSILNAFDCGISGLGEITFLRTWPFRRLTTDLHDNYY